MILELKNWFYGLSDKSCFHTCHNGLVPGHDGCPHPLYHLFMFASAQTHPCTVESSSLPCKIYWVKPCLGSKLRVGQILQPPSSSFGHSGLRCGSCAFGALLLPHLIRTLPKYTGAMPKSTSERWFGVADSICPQQRQHTTLKFLDCHVQPSRLH